MTGEVGEEGVASVPAGTIGVAQGAGGCSGAVLGEQADLLRGGETVILPEALTVGA